MLTTFTTNTQFDEYITCDSHDGCHELELSQSFRSSITAIVSRDIHIGIIRDGPATTSKTAATTTTVRKFTAAATTTTTHAGVPKNQPDWQKFLVLWLGL